MKFFERKGKEIARHAVATLACALMLVGLIPGNMGAMSVQAAKTIEANGDIKFYSVKKTGQQNESNQITSPVEVTYGTDYEIYATAKFSVTLSTGTKWEYPKATTVNYYSDESCSQKLNSKPTDAGTYYVKSEYAGETIDVSTVSDGDSVKCNPVTSSVLTLRIKSATQSIDSVAITGIDTPTAGTALDTTAVCETTGVETTAPEIKWTANNTGASGEAAYGTVYTAGVTLTAASGYEFSSTTTATINGNKASTSYDADKGTLYVYYDFPATADAAPETYATTSTAIQEAGLAGVRVKTGDIIYFNNDKDEWADLRVCTVKEAVDQYGCTYNADTDVKANDYIGEFSKGNTYKIEGDYDADDYTISSNNWIVYFYEDYYYYIIIPASAEPCTTHTYGDASYTWDGTSCTATRKCSVCGDEQKETVTATVTVTQEASCEQAELSTYTATFKNSAFATQTKTGVETKAALGHTLGDYTVTKPATIDAAGLKQQICSVCGKAFNDQEIAQLTDTYKPSGASGSVVVEAKPAASVPTTSLATNATDVVTLLTNSNNLTSDELTQVQNGATVKIVLDVADKDATMKADTANLIKAKADSESLEIGQYLDITLTKYINEAEIAKIKDLGSSTVTVSMLLPDSLIKDGRTYYIIRQHVADDGSKQVDLLDTTYYKEAKTITFETSLFSDYAIAYKDSDSQPSQPDGGNNGGNNGSNGGSAAATTTASTSTTTTAATDTAAEDVATTDTTPAKLSPKTGEVATTTWLYVLLFASLAGFFGVVSFKRKEQ